MVINKNLGDKNWTGAELTDLPNRVTKNLLNPNNFERDLELAAGLQDENLPPQ